jgi:hypothetical protein
MNKKISIIATLFAIVCILMSAMPAQAEESSDTFGFNPCNPSDEDWDQDVIDIVQDQIHVVVSVEEGFARFLFTNEGEANAVIAAVYFADGDLFEEGSGVISDYEGDVDFDLGATPGVPPGCLQSFTTVFFAADAEDPSPLYGVGPGEWLEVTFTLLDGVGIGDVINALNTGDLLVGIHATGVGYGDDTEGSGGFTTENGTAITLAGFGCAASRQEVTVSWVTGTELNNAGFNIYRSLTPAGPQMKVNGALLRAVGEGVSGASYSIVDQPGYGVFYYWLEDVDYSGRTTLHGPAAVTVKTPYRLPAYRPVIPGSK